MREFLRKRLFLKSQKVAVTCYYGTEGPFTSRNFKTAPFLVELRSAVCWLSRATGSQKGLILMLRKLPPLGEAEVRTSFHILLAKITKITLAFFFL